MYFYEYRPDTVRGHRVELVLERDLVSRHGFRSVFGFSEQVADVITSSGSTRGLNSMAVYADTLFLDFDNNPEAEDMAQAKLLAMGCAFSVYSTGGRGKHFHVAIVPMEGVAVNLYIKSFVSKEFPGADLSIYKKTGIIRLPGTFHKKHAGNRKTLISNHPGAPLVIPEEIEIGNSRRVPHLDASEDDSNKTLLTWLFKPVGEGGRNNRLFILAMLCKDTGMSREETESLLSMYNKDRVYPPVGDNELLSTVRSAYAQVY